MRKGNHCWPIKCSMAFHIENSSGQVLMTRICFGQVEWGFTISIKEAAIHICHRMPSSLPSTVSKSGPPSSKLRAIRIVQNQVIGFSINSHRCLTGRIHFIHRKFRDLKPKGSHFVIILPEFPLYTVSFAPARVIYSPYMSVLCLKTNHGYLHTIARNPRYIHSGD